MQPESVTSSLLGTAFWVCCWRQPRVLQAECFVCWLLLRSRRRNSRVRGLHRGMLHFAKLSLISQFVVWKNLKELEKGGRGESEARSCYWGWCLSGSMFDFFFARLGVQTRLWSHGKDAYFSATQNWGECQLLNLCFSFLWTDLSLLPPRMKESFDSSCIVFLIDCLQKGALHLGWEVLTQ